MIIIVGLGNPGEKFNHTPHNVGFDALDFFATKNNFPKFALSKKYSAMISEKDEVILVKPQTFMNESGGAVKKIVKSYQVIKLSSLVVVHDDIDLPLGKLKISKDSGAGGHKGVDSVISNLGTKDFIRIKIGVCPLSGKPDGVETFVIKKFNLDGQEAIKSVISKTTEVINALTNEGVEKAMNQFNQ